MTFISDKAFARPLSIERKELSIKTANIISQIEYKANNWLGVLVRQEKEIN